MTHRLTLSSICRSVTYILWSSDYDSYLEDYLIEKCCTWDNGSVWLKGSIYGPPADKRDLTTFCNKLTNKHLKSVENHNFLLSFKDGSFMRDA